MRSIKTPQLRGNTPPVIRPKGTGNKYKAKFNKGFNDGTAGKKGDLTDEQMQDIMEAFQKSMMEKGQEKAKKSSVGGAQRHGDAQGFLEPRK